MQVVGVAIKCLSWGAEPMVKYNNDNNKSTHTEVASNISIAELPFPINLDTLIIAKSKTHVTAKQHVAYS